MAQRRRHGDYDDAGDAKYQQLTEGERAIWAAAFTSPVPTTAGLTDEQVMKYLTTRAHDAVAAARRYARTLRDDDSEAAHMVRQMVNRREADRAQDDEADDVLEWLHHNRFEETAKVFRGEAGIRREDDDGSRED
jgi:hypothetical protein